MTGKAMSDISEKIKATLSKEKVQKVRVSDLRPTASYGGVMAYKYGTNYLLAEPAFNEYETAIDMRIDKPKEQKARVLVKKVRKEIDKTQFLSKLLKRNRLNQ